MRIGVIPENLVERLAILSGLAPVPLAESWFTFHLANAIMVATRAGLYEALEAGPLRAAELAEKMGTHQGATVRLVHALIGIGHVTADGGRYALAPVARKWLLASSRHSSRDKILFQFLERKWLDHTEEYLRTGKPLALHEHLGEEEWALYQRGMRSGVEVLANEVVRRLALPRSPARMLDIGGSHGYFSVAFCRRHPTLRSTILDLPQAIPHAAPILAKEKMGDRVVHRAGNALEDDLGRGEYDLIFMASLAHHFDDATNRALAARCAGVLRPGGVLAIYDAIRADPSGCIGQIGGLLDLFFGITSESGTWSAEEMAGWQRAAGLRPRKLMRLRIVRDVGVQAAVKP